MAKLRSTVVIAAVLYFAIVASLALVYLRQSAAYGTTAPLMPVDDAYIHFQYARQAANGEPFVYNVGQAPSSGATSLLYPFVLALGYKLGFTDLNLGFWAYLVGALALFISALTVRAASLAAGLPQWLAITMGAAVASWGVLVWHAFSGMETAIVVAFTLLTFHTFERERRGPFVISASILAMLRPEASVMAVLAAALYFIREYVGLVRRHRSNVSTGVNHSNTIPASRVPFSRFALFLVVIPIAVAAIQPLINQSLTGSSNAAGSQAKSLLSIVPFDLGYVAGRIFDNLIHAWEAFLFGIGRDGVWMLPPLIGIAALFGLYRIARQRPLTALLPLLWLFIIYAAIATLDTAGWHFRRYQMPLLALAFPLTAHTAAALAAYPRSRSRLVGYTLILSIFLNQIFFGYHAANVESVAAQPLAMARWISTNTPRDSLIAVHDVGLIRYMGGRDTLDMVGLTTSGMADAWRNGPGVVGEALINAPRRPDYFAAYDDARGLSYLADSLYGELLAGFTHEFDAKSNVALGGTFQGIYQPSWQGAEAALEPRVDAVRRYLDRFVLSDMLNVAELSSEREHGYTWQNTARFDGFASEIYRLNVPGCSSDCHILDGGRRMNGGEAFTLSALSGRDHILVSRFHAPDGGKIRVVINNAFVVERTLPALPGQFIEIPTLIPAAQVETDTLSVRIEPVASATLILPYRHWLYAGEFEITQSSQVPITFQTDAITLSASASLDNAALTVDMNWWTDGAATGDLVAFVHLYADLNSPPVAQSDMRPGGGALPPGAWLPGRLIDRIVLDLSEFSAGTYTLAVGLYDAVTLERIEPSLGQPEFEINAGRVLIDVITVPAK